MMTTCKIDTIKTLWLMNPQWSYNRPSVIFVETEILFSLLRNFQLNRTTKTVLGVKSAAKPIPESSTVV